MTRLASEDDFLAAIDRHFTNAHPTCAWGAATTAPSSPARRAWP